mgnify:CR=1 FL=1
MAVAWQLKNIKEGSVFDEKHSKTRARVDAEKLYLLDVKQARQLMGDELVPALSWARRAQVPRWGWARQGGKSSA